MEEEKRGPEKQPLIFLPIKFLFMISVTMNKAIIYVFSFKNVKLRKTIFI